MIAKIIRKDIIHKIKQKIQLTNEMIARQRNYKLADNLPHLEFIDFAGQDKYIEYTKNLLVKDLTSDCLTIEGLTILQLKALEDCTSISHIHANQSQTIYVKKGKIIDLVSKITFVKGQSFFTPSNNIHTIKYLKGAIVTIVYLPNLEIIEEKNKN